MGRLTEGYKGDLIINEDEKDLPLHWRKVKNQKSYFQKYRFASPKYVNDLRQQSYTKEVVIKKIAAGFGRKHANILFRYIMRDLEHQRTQEQQKVEIEDNYGRIWNADNYKEVLNKWQEDFVPADSKNYKTIEEYSFELSELQHKKLDMQISLKEENRLTYLMEEDPRRLLYKKVKKDFTHLVFSPGGKGSEGAMKEAMRNFLDKNIAAQGYDYVFAFHTDTANHHFHVIIKNSNNLDRRKGLYFDKFDFATLRHEFAKCLDAVGIDRTATRTYDRADYLNQLKESPEKIIKKIENYSKKLNQVEENKTFNAIKEKENIKKQLATKIAQIDKQIEKGQKDLKEVRAVLIKLEKAFSTTSPEELQVMTDKTIKELEKYHDKVSLELNKGLKKTEGKSLSERNRKKIFAMVDQLEEKRQAELSDTQSIIDNMMIGADKEKKTKLGLMTKELEKIRLNLRKYEKGIDINKN